MASRKGKGNNTSGRVREKVIGEMVKVFNMSNNDYYCEQTGQLLPKRGIVARYKDKLFINRRALNTWIAQNESD
jgi:hypothetical protein